MAFSELSAKEIGEQQLLAALKLWKERDYMSALTLAGAAEEILGNRLRQQGRETSFDQVKREILAEVERCRDCDPDGQEEKSIASLPKLVADLLNDPRNELKHYEEDDMLSLDLQAEAILMLERALINYHRLTGCVLSEAMDFWGDQNDS